MNSNNMTNPLGNLKKKNSSFSAVKLILFHIAYVFCLSRQYKYTVLLRVLIHQKISQRTLK